jgi:3-hydroxyacyl-CoA dehydrogenase/enoyl-CoA hydratase/3-hydroxybutyryl-CoA epimerase
MTSNKPGGTGFSPGKAIPQHIIVRKKRSGVAFLLFDSPGKLNFLTSEVIDELNLAITDVANDKDVKAMVVISGKADTFVTGADLHEIMRFSNQMDGLKLSRHGHNVFAALADLKKPTVAAINGVCLGGGLELVLCCDRRIATDAPITVLGLPEVRHGLVPGLGGTQRLPRQIGIRNALEIILGGDLVDAHRAYDMKIVDQIVPSDNLMERAEQLAIELLDIPEEQRKIIAPLESAEKLSKLFFICARSVRIKTKGRYPAQLRVLDVIKTGLIEGFEAGTEAEITTFAELAVSDVARNLIFLFFSKELAKQTAKIASRNSNVRLNSVSIVTWERNPGKLANLGIASGLKVSLIETNEHTLRDTANNPNILNADLIIESASEDKDTKVKILSHLAKIMKPDAVLATVSSSHSISALAASIPNNQNFIGIQLIHPIDKMPLAELISHPNTSKFALAQATKFISKIGKLSMSVQDSPGYLLNRILTVYLLQAARMAESGVPVNWLEKSAINFGMPMGPFSVLDEIGLDLARTVATVLNEKLASRFKVPDSLSKALSAGMIGRESGCGTYVWHDDKKIEFNADLQTKLGFVISEKSLPPDQATTIAHAMILPMVDEASRCLDEKIVRHAREIDLCMVMGLGFPSFRGGLLRYADSIGIKQIIDEIQEIYIQTAPASQVSDYLKRLVQENRSFYSRAVEQN